MEYQNRELGNRLLERKKEGLCLRVRYATPFDLGSFQPERSKCHDNVDRWCLEHRDHKPPLLYYEAGCHSRWSELRRWLRTKARLRQSENC